ncbi:MAG: 5'-nucleotidase C-terminal domain-containing protein [bacterium]
MIKTGFFMPHVSCLMSRALITMWKRSLLILILVLAPAIASAAPTHLTILHFNDLHGHLEAEANGSGGAARIAAIVKSIEAENTKKGWDTIVLHGGDALTGSTLSKEFRGEVEMAFLRAIGTDAAVIGNHEFDQGKERLGELMGSAGFPILSANIFTGNTGEHFAEPSEIVAMQDGLRVAILGLTMAGTPHVTKPTNVEGLKFADSEKEARRDVPALRRHSDIMIALTHEGVKEDVALAKSVKGIDVVVGGHDHVKPDGYCRSVGRVPVCQTPAEGRYVGRIDFDMSGKTPSLLGWELIPVSSDVAPDNDVEALVQRFAAPTKAKYDKVIGVAADDFENGEGKETILGRHVALAMRQKTDADAAFINSSGIRAPLRKGKIRLRDVDAVLPFPNKLVVLDIKGSELIGALSRGIAGKGSYPQVAGMELKISGNGLTGITIRNDALDPDKIYRIATVDFVAMGGGAYSMLKKIPDERKEYTDILVADAFADYVKSKKVLK